MKIKNKIISGWSKSNFSNCNYFEAETVEQIADCFELAKKNKNLICFRGGGRSYGDNTLNKNNIVLRYKPTQNIISFEEIKGEITVSGNCNLIEILKWNIENTQKQEPELTELTASATHLAEKEEKKLDLDA